jgi:hypothetical protein
MKLAKLPRIVEKHVVLYVKTLHIFTFSFPPFRFKQVSGSGCMNSLPSYTSTNEQINLRHTKFASHCFPEASQLSQMYVRLEMHYSGRVVITLSQTKHAEFSLKALYKCFMIVFGSLYKYLHCVQEFFLLILLIYVVEKKNEMILVSFVDNSGENITIPSCEVTYSVGKALTDK